MNIGAIVRRIAEAFDLPLGDARPTRPAPGTGVAPQGHAMHSGKSPASTDSIDRGPSATAASVKLISPADYAAAAQSAEDARRATKAAAIRELVEQTTPSLEAALSSMERTFVDPHALPAPVLLSSEHVTYWKDCLYATSAGLDAAAHGAIDAHVRSLLGPTATFAIETKLFVHSPINCESRATHSVEIWLNDVKGIVPREPSEQRAARLERAAAELAEHTLPNIPRQQFLAAEASKPVDEPLLAFQLVAKKFSVERATPHRDWESGRFASEFKLTVPMYGDVTWSPEVQRAYADALEARLRGTPYTLGHLSERDRSDGYRNRREVCVSLKLKG